MLKKMLIVATIGLLAILLGVSTVLASPAKSSPPITPSPTTICIPCPLCANPVACVIRTITNADNNKTITLKVGDTFLLALDTNYIWTVTLPSSTIVKRIGDGPKGTQGIYQAIGKGTVILSATGSPVCLPLGCAQPSLLFKVTLVVQ